MLHRLTYCYEIACSKPYEKSICRNWESLQYDGTWDEGKLLPQVHFVSRSKCIQKLTVGSFEINHKLLCPEDSRCYMPPDSAPDAKTSLQPNEVQDLVAMNPKENGVQDNNGQQPTFENENHLLDHSEEDSNLNPVLEPVKQRELNVFASEQSGTGDQTLYLD